MALQSAYDSKINRSFDKATTMLDIKQSALAGQLKGYNDEILFITESENVGPFTHPIYDVDKDVVYIDVRPHTNIDKNGDLKIRNVVDHDFAIMRAKSELVWIRCEKKSEIFGSNRYSNEMFCRWFSSLISYRFGLSSMQEMRIMALTGLYIIGLHFNEINDSEIPKYLRVVTELVPVSMDVVMEVSTILEQSFPRDIDEFVSAIGTIDLGPRMNNFNSTGIYNMLGGGWFGVTYANEHLALALEYPMTFASIVRTSITNIMFKRTTIGEQVYKFKRNNSHHNFEKSFDRLLERYTEEGDV